MTENADKSDEYKTQEKEALQLRVEMSREINLNIVAVILASAWVHISRTRRMHRRMATFHERETHICRANL